MALSTKLTSFVWASTDIVGTTFDVTCGFQPKCVILWTSGVTVDSVVRGSCVCAFGVGTSDTDRRAVQFRSQDAQTSANIGVRQSSAAILTLCAVTATTDWGLLDIAPLANWPSDGIRFVVDTVAFGTNLVHVLAIGGSDITAAKTLQFIEAAATGNATIAHGLGTTPTGALFCSVGYINNPFDSPMTNTQGSFSLGAYDGTNSWVIAGGGDDANTTMVTRGYGKSGEIIALGPEPYSTINARATGVSFGGTNITINWATRAALRYVFGLTWAGGQFKVGTTTTATNTTPFNGPAAGFVPTAAIFASANRAESTTATVTATTQFSFGAATSASERAAFAFLDRDAVGTSECSRALDSDAVYVNMDTTPVAVGLMDVATMADPISLVMDDADPSGCFVGMAMWGSLAGAPPGPISDLNATAVSSTQVDLTWTAAADATSHRIERSTVG